MFNILSLTLDSQILFRQIGYIAPLALNHETLDCVCYLWETVAAKMLYFLPILRNYPFIEYYSMQHILSTPSLTYTHAYICVVISM